MALMTFHNILTIIRKSFCWKGEIFFMNEINKIEEIGTHIHPALEKMEYDGWLLQISGGGASRRANSIMAFETGIIPLEEKVSECEKIYTEHNLPCTFKMTKAAPDGLYELLQEKGYAYNAETNLMTVMAEDEAFGGRCESIIEPEETGVIITTKPDDAWLDCYFKWENRTEQKMIEINKKQFEIVDDDKNLSAVYCRIQMGGIDVAVASVVIENGLGFLLNVIVDEKVRGKGYGKILVKETLEAACSFGAEKFCLQVDSNNSTAIGLYESFGFEFLYKYWYMVK